jgi:RNA polymerase sigma-70 factor, ECF subfamily
MEDVLQDVFVSFARQAGQFKLLGSLKGYLSICAANCARDKNRQQYRQQNAVQNGDKIPINIPGPEQNAIRNEQHEKLNLALEELTFEQRETIVLHLQSKMRFREIAKLRGVSINTIQSQYRYGLNKIRSILEDEADI